MSMLRDIVKLERDKIELQTDIELLALDYKEAINMIIKRDEELEIIKSKLGETLAENHILQEQVIRYDYEYDKLKEQNDELKRIISEIEERAFDWDGRESMHYGNIIMKIIHKNWGKDA